LNWKGSTNATTEKGKRFTKWNETLSTAASAFAASHPPNEVSVLVFSAFDTFNRVLDDPVAYGFKEEDKRKKNGGIWFDHLHPTTKMHDVIAKEFAEFLDGIQPQEAPAEPEVKGVAAKVREWIESECQ